MPDDGAQRRRAVLVTLAAFVLAGVVAGLVWPHLVPHPRMVATDQGPVPLTELDAGRLIAMDGWYAVLAAGLGALGGIGLFTAFRRHGPWVVGAVAAGSVLAAAVMLVVGTYVGSGEVILAWAPDATAGTRLRAPVSVRAYGVVAVWPLAALIPVLVLSWLLPWGPGPTRAVHRRRAPRRQPPAPPG